MKPTNAEIFRILNELTAGKKFTDYDSVVQPFVWEVVEQGELTAKKLLLSNQIWNKPSLKVQTIETFLQELEQRGNCYNYLILPEERIKFLLSILQSKLTDIQIYLGYFPDNTFEVYVGKTKNNVWFGICTPVSYGYYDLARRFPQGSSERFLIKNPVSPDSDILELQNQLVAEGFFLDDEFSEKRFRWEIGQSSDEVLEKILSSFKFLVIQEFEAIQILALQFDVELRNLEEEGGGREIDIEFYVDPDSGEEWEIEIYRRTPPEYPRNKDYRAIDSFLKSRLTNLRIYAIGAVTCRIFNIYVIGNTEEEDWAGVLLNVELDE
ncbi:MAG: nuclease A inhibitor family protein [Crinalium sp.]